MKFSTNPALQAMERMQDELTINLVTVPAIREEAFERLASYCDEPADLDLSDGPLTLYEILHELCLLSGCGMVIWFREGELDVEPSDPLQSRVTEPV